MAVNARADIVIQMAASDPPKDLVTNVAYFTTAGSPGPSDWTALANELKTIFTSNTRHFGLFQQHGVTVTLWDMADPKPRPEKAHVVYVPTTWSSSTMGPRQVALCLSFYAGRNLKRQRGRLFIGEWSQSACEETPRTGDMNTVIGLGQDFLDLPTRGSIAWNHAVHSTVDNNYQVVTNYWVDNRWDTQRRRLSKASSRSTLP